MKRQDMQGVKTPSDIERKYDLAAIKDLKGAVKSALDKATEALKLAQGAGGGGANGFLSFEVDDDGNLYVVTSGDGDPPAFEYDESSGNLYYITEEV